MVLSIHLNKALGDTISENQSAFVTGRQILDYTLVANEVIDDIRERSKHCLVFKLDFEKASDRVSWSLLDEVLERRGYGPRWGNWISGCLATIFFGNC